MKIKVNSSAINSIDYKNDNLFITFNSGRTYRYLNVEKSLVKDFIKADSIGKFFNQKIKNNYTAEKCEVRY